MNLFHLLEDTGRELMRTLLEVRGVGEAYVEPLRVLAQGWGAVQGQVYAPHGKEWGFGVDTAASAWRSTRPHFSSSV